MSIVAVVPVGNLLAANATLQAAGFGKNNFSVPAYAGVAPTHAALHAWNDVAFSTAVKALAGVVVNEGAGDPVARTKALIEAQGAKRGAQAPQLPASGNVATGALYQLDGQLWYVITGFSRTTYPDPPAAYPALIRRARVPGETAPWIQPTDSFDAYKLVNPFTGQPDTCTYSGKTWRVSQADGTGNNIWVPGQYGWIEVDAHGNEVIPPPVDEWPLFVQPTHAGNAYALGAKITFEGKRYVSKLAANTYSPTAYAAGWELQP